MMAFWPAWTTVNVVACVVAGAGIAFTDDWTFGIGAACNLVAFFICLAQLPSCEVPR